MVDIPPKTPAKMPGFFAALINGDEMAFIALVITASGLATLACDIALTAYAVVVRGQHFDGSEFCQSAAILLGALTSAIGALAGFMGVKAKLGG
jgi:hypothetical protein